MITSASSSRRLTVLRRSAFLAALAVGAVLLAGCAVLGGGEEPADAPVATAAGVAHEGRAGSDPVNPVYDPGPALDLSAEPDAAVADEGLLPAWSAWTLEVPEAFGPFVEGTPPPPPEPLVDKLPAGSVFVSERAPLDPQLAVWLTDPSIESAARVAYSALDGTVRLVNDGDAEPFATLASSQCEYCLFRLAAATAIHDGGGDLPQPWRVEVDDAVGMGEVTGPEYVAIEFTGVDHGLAYRTPGSGADSLIGLPGEFTWRVDMMYSAGRWWVIEVFAL